MDWEEQRLELIEGLLSSSSPSQLAMQEAVSVLLYMAQDDTSSSGGDSPQVIAPATHPLYYSQHCITHSTATRPLCYSQQTLLVFYLFSHHYSKQLSMHVTSWVDFLPDVA